MGKPSTSETINGFRQTRCKGQQEENGSGSESEAVRQVEGLLGGENKPVRSKPKQLDVGEVAKSHVRVSTSDALFVRRLLP